MNEENKSEIRQIVREEFNRFFHQSEAVKRSVKQRHLEGEIIFRGLAASRPTGSSEVKVFFATNTGVLSIWTGTAWLNTTLS